MKISLFRFVRHEQAADYLRCGWLARPILDGTHHGFWSVAVEWLCDCKPVFPERNAGGSIG